MLSNLAKTLGAVVVLLAVACPSLGLAVAGEGSHPRFVLVNIRNWSEYRSIRGQLQQIDGVEAVRVASSTAGLIVLEADFASTASDFFEKCVSVFGDKYTLSDKKLPSGVLEINLAKR